MALTTKFIEAVNSNNKVRVRIMLKDIMLVDPTMKQFDEMLDYAKSNLSDLYDEHDGENLIFDNAKWNIDYLNKQMVTVVTNFSVERVNLLRNMVKHIYHDRVERMNTTSTTNKNHHISKKQIGKGITGFGTAVAITGVCAHSGALLAGGVIVAAVGVGMIFTDKR